MAVSVIEVATGASTTATTHTVTLATTPTAGDVLVVIHARSSQSTTSASGCGASWSQAFTINVNSAQNVDYFVGTGANASGVITVTLGTSRLGIARVFLVRGLTSSATVAADCTQGSVNNSTITGPSDTAYADCFVAAVQFLNSTASSTLFSATTPGSGWTTQTAAGNMNTSYLLPTGTQSVDSSFSTTASRNYGIGNFIIGPTGAATGTTSTTLPALTQAAAGATVPPAFTGTAASTFAPLTQAAAGAFVSSARTGTATTTLPALAQSAAGATVPPPVTGTAASALPHLTQAAAGTTGTGTPDLAPGRYAALHLYDTDGTTFLADLVNADQIQFQEKNSDIGVVSFRIPLADAAAITDRRIVKVSLFGAMVFACVIRSEACSLVDGTVWVRFENQPGLLSLLSDGSARPEYGLERNGGTERRFGWMSKAGSWIIGADWNLPDGFTYETGITVPARGRTPSAFAASNPYWISAAGPAVNVSEDDINYFRCTFTTSVRKAFEFEVSGDNFLTLDLDGEELLTPDPADPHGWYAPSTPRVSIPAGDHVLAASVANSYYNGGLSSEDHRNNPIALIMTVWELDAAGERDSIFLQTNLTDWDVHDGDPEPGWHRAQVLRTLIVEAIDRADTAGGATSGVQLFDGMVDFTSDEDSDGNDWTDRGQYTVDVGTVGLADIAVGLAEKDFDLWVDPDSRELKALIRRGADMTGTVELTVGEGGNLLEYETTRSTARFTSVLMRLAGDTWYLVEDDDAIAAYGLIETGLDVGSTSSRPTAAQLGQQLLDESGVPIVTVAAKTSTIAGPMPYNGINMGDTVLLPGHRGVGTIAARALVFTYNGTGDTPELYADFVEDRTV